MSTRPATTSTKPAPLVYVATSPLVLIDDTNRATHYVYDGKRNGPTPRGTHPGIEQTGHRAVYRLPR
jgi:hypothetical protein